MLAPNAKMRAQVVPQGPDAGAEASKPAECEANCAHHRPVRLSWARLLERAFELDLEHCPNCGGELKIIDFGKDLVAGLKAGLGDQASRLIVREASYNVSDPTVDSQIITLQDSGANVFLNASTPKFAAQAIRKASDIGWKPTQFVAFVSSSIGSVLTPAGLEKSKDLISIQFLKDYSDPQWSADAGMNTCLRAIQRTF